MSKRYPYFSKKDLKKFWVTCYWILICQKELPCQKMKNHISIWKNLGVWESSLGKVSVFIWPHHRDSYHYAGSIRRSLVPEFFSLDTEGTVKYKIRDGVIFYRWSVLSKHGAGFWPFIHTEKSDQLPTILKDLIKSQTEPK